MKNQKLVFFHPSQEMNKRMHLAEEGISAGFPSPADDFKELRISIDQEVVRNEESTFYARVSGESMQGAGLDNGDLLVIDNFNLDDLITSGLYSILKNLNLINRKLPMLIGDSGSIN